MLFETRSKQADEAYHIQIQEIISKLVVEYHGILSNQPGQMFSSISKKNASDLYFQESDSTNIRDDRLKTFLWHLNKSGAYFYFKEQLKSVVVQVVRQVYVINLSALDKNRHLLLVLNDNCSCRRFTFI